MRTVRPGKIKRGDINNQTGEVYCKEAVLTYSIEIYFSTEKVYLLKISFAWKIFYIKAIQ